MFKGQPKTYKRVPLWTQYNEYGHPSERCPCAAGCHRTARRVGGRCRVCERNDNPVVIQMKPAEAKKAPLAEQENREQLILAHEARIQAELAALEARRVKPSEEERQRAKLANTLRQQARTRQKRKHSNKTLEKKNG